MKRIEWNDYFLNMINVIKTRSPDPSRQVGSVIVTVKGNRLISTGYNGLPCGLDDNIDWEDRDFVKNVVIHSETNAILHMKNDSKEELKMYITTSPCKECIKLIASSGIKTVYYQEEYRDIAQVKDICKFFGVTLSKI